MEYKGYSIELTTKTDKLGQVTDVIYKVRRSGEPAIVYSGVIAGDLSSANDATDAALTKARNWIDAQPA